jgi:hypothetical protein
MVSSRLWSPLVSLTALHDSEALHASVPGYRALQARHGAKRDDVVSCPHVGNHWQ